MAAKLVGARGSVHSLEALIHAAEEGNPSADLGSALPVSKKELKEAAQCEEAPLVEPEETVEPPEEPAEDVEESGESRTPRFGLGRALGWPPH